MPPDAHAEPPEESVAAADRVLVAASGFTSLWALTWLAAGAVSGAAAVHGGFAAGGLMAGSGLSLLWWKTRAIREYQADQDDEPPADTGAAPE